MKRHLFLVITLLFSRYIGYGQTKPEALLTDLKSLIKEKHIPGLMVSIVTKDSILFSDGIGFADLEKHEKVTGNHLFRVGSISKSFTALALYKLTNGKSINLNKSIREIDLDIPFHNPWESEYPVTIAQLLEHTAGFDNFHLHAMYNVKDSLVPEAIEMVKSHKNSLVSRWQPGTRKAYSNSGYVVAGHLVEKISKRPFTHYLTKEVLQPLGMFHSGFYFKEPKNKLLARGYNYRGGKYAQVPFYSIQGSAAGEFCTSANEISKYLQFLLGREGCLLDSIIFDKSAFDRLENSKTSIAAKAGLPGGYGLGNYSVWKNGNRFYGHSGGIDGFSSRYVYSREANLGVAVAMNREGNANEIVNLILDHYLPKDQVKPERIVLSIPDSLKKRYEGYYRFESPKNELLSFSDRMLAGVDLQFAKDSIVVNGILGKYKATLFYAGNHLFYRDKEGIESVAFLSDEEGNPVLWFNENYTVKESRMKRIFLNFVVWISMVLPFVFLLTGSVWMLIQVFKKSKKSLHNHLILWSACFCYFLVIVAFALAMGNRVESGNLNFNSILLFISSLAIIPLTILSIWVCFKITVKGFPKWYFILNTSAISVVTLFFLDNGFIGLRLWAY